MPRKIPTRRAVLLGLARRCRVVDARSAAGRCLGASLDLALAAHRRGLAVDLVRWTVQGDPDYADHWAVRLDARHVLDLTRVQVDGSTRLVVEADDYPRHFVDRREYPAALFLHDYAASGEAQREVLSAAIMLRMARRMFRYDASTAWRAFFPVRCLGLLARFAGAHLRVGREASMRRLQAHRAELARKLG